MKRIIVIIFIILPFLLKAQVPTLSLDTTYKNKSIETGVLVAKGDVYFPKLASADTTYFAAYDAFGKSILRRVTSGGGGGIDNSGSGVTNMVPYYTGAKLLSTTSNIWHNGGNVGIGTTTPQGLLTVSAGGADGLEISTSNGVGGGTSTQSYNRTGSAYINHTAYAKEIHLFSVDAGNDAFIVSGTGNTSVNNFKVSTLATGLTAPTTTGTTKMVVVDANGLLSNAAIPGGGGGGSYTATAPITLTGSAFGVDTTAETPTALVTNNRLNNSIANFINNTGSGTVNSIPYYTAAKTLSNTSLISTNGLWLGINVGNPVNLNSQLVVSNGGNEQMEFFTTVGIGGGCGFLNYNRGSSPGYVNFTTYAKQMHFFSTDFGGEAITVTGTGVGINNVSPTEKLDVDGNTRIRSLASGGTAPTLTGLTKSVIVDANGKLGFSKEPIIESFDIVTSDDTDNEIGVYSLSNSQSVNITIRYTVIDQNGNFVQSGKIGRTVLKNAAGTIIEGSTTTIEAQSEVGTRTGAALTIRIGNNGFGGASAFIKGSNSIGYRWKVSLQGTRANP